MESDGYHKIAKHGRKPRGSACSSPPARLFFRQQSRPIMYALLLLLILVPAPKAEPIKECPYVGAWTFYWGAGEQTTHFYADGTCWSPEYESGVWSVDDDGALWFSERNNESQYVMMIDWQAGGGSGWRWDAGELRGNVPVVIRRGEKLMMPREIR